MGLSVWKCLKKAFNFSETILKIFSLAGKTESWIMVFSLRAFIFGIGLFAFLKTTYQQGVIELFEHKSHFHTTCAHKTAADNQEFQ